MASSSQSPIEPSRSMSLRKKDYQSVYNAIAQKLASDKSYDDGSYGPALVRLAFHASGTYDAKSGTGGSNGATMRFSPENGHGANRGMGVVRDFLEPFKQQFPWISYGDLWTLGGVCAVQEMGGPDVAWRPGREDKDGTYCTPDHRLPEGSKKQDHIREIFYRMGFNDQEIVALLGAHALGRCHTERSGFDGPWTRSPTRVTNGYYRHLLNDVRELKDWDGPKQYVDSATKSLMMLPSDVALIEDEDFRQYVQKYAADQGIFFEDFSNAIIKLFELGVPFQISEDDRMVFDRTK